MSVQVIGVEILTVLFETGQVEVIKTEVDKKGFISVKLQILL